MRKRRKTQRRAQRKLPLLKLCAALKAQMDVPSPHSSFPRRCLRRSGTSHRGALGGLRLLLAVLRFHGGEEQHLLQTESVSGRADRHHHIPRGGLARAALAAAALRLTALSKGTKELFPAGILRFKKSHAAALPGTGFVEEMASLAVSHSHCLCLP